MLWIWQKKTWPRFQYDPKAIEELENQYLQFSGIFTGSSKYLDLTDKNSMIVDLLCEEALKTSEIEGEILNHDSLRSSLRQHLGLSKGKAKTMPREEGIAEVMIDLYQNFHTPLSEESLCQWNLMITKSRWDLNEVGCYRTHPDPMQIVSGSIHHPKIHYEAPPSHRIPREMEVFLKWFNHSAFDEAKSLSPLLRAALSHLYFLCIHPFEDGNGRIARAITIKSLSQSLNQPVLLALSHSIHHHKKKYYSELAKTNHHNEITEWLIYFSQTILEAQKYTQSLIDFLIFKLKFYMRFEKKLNERQKKVIDRIFKEGPKGFEGGLSAKNYISITQTSASTATRDLQELVEMGVFSRQGELKATRYFLVFH